MSVNTSHPSNGQGVIIYSGEILIIHTTGCDLKLSGPIKGSYSGSVYLTSHRIIFVNKKMAGSLLSLSMPFMNLRQVDIEQPVFGANKIVGKLLAEPGAPWKDLANFSLTFNKGGAIELGQTLLRLGQLASSQQQRPQTQGPPAASMYPPVPQQQAPAWSYYQCPPPAYYPPQQQTNDNYYTFVRQHESFTQPEPQTMYYYAQPPPYSGAVPTTYVGVGWGQAQQPLPPPAGQVTSPPPYPTTVPAGSQQDYHQGAAAPTGGLYFNADPHSVYAPQASAPPLASSVNGPPPAYSEEIKKKQE